MSIWVYILIYEYMSIWVYEYDTVATFGISTATAALMHRPATYNYFSCALTAPPPPKKQRLKWSPAGVTIAKDPESLWRDRQLWNGNSWVLLCNAPFIRHFMKVVEDFFNKNMKKWSGWWFLEKSHQKCRCVYFETVLAPITHVWYFLQVWKCRKIALLVYISGHTCC